MTGDSLVLNLCHNWTAGLLLAFGLILGGIQIVASPLECISSGREASNTYCWASELSLLEKDNYDSFGSSEERTYLRSHRWTPALFLMLAAILYIPKLLWTAWDAGQLKRLQTSNSKLIQRTWRTRLYPLVYYVCYGLSLVSLVVAFKAADNFFDGRSDGQISLPEDEYQVLPVSVRCIHDYVGPSGAKYTEDVRCTLWVNKITEEFLVITWMAFVALMTVVSFGLLKALLTYLMPPITRLCLGLYVRDRALVADLSSKHRISNLFWVQRMLPYAEDMDQVARNLIKSD